MLIKTEKLLELVQRTSYGFVHPGGKRANASKTKAPAKEANTGDEFDYCCEVDLSGYIPHFISLWSSTMLVMNA